jgi:hypothetical protein
MYSLLPGSPHSWADKTVGLNETIQLIYSLVVEDALYIEAYLHALVHIYLFQINS